MRFLEVGQHVSKHRRCFPRTNTPAKLGFPCHFLDLSGEGEGRAGCVKVLHNFVSRDSLDRLRKCHSCKLRVAMESVCVVEDVCIDCARHPPFCGR